MTRRGENTAKQIGASCQTTRKTIGRHRSVSVLSTRVAGVLTKRNNRGDLPGRARVKSFERARFRRNLLIPAAARLAKRTLTDKALIYIVLLKHGGGDEAALLEPADSAEARFSL